MQIAEIRGKKGKWIRKGGFASIYINEEEQYVAKISKGNTAFIVEDISGEIVLVRLKDRHDVIIKHDETELAKINSANKFLTFQRFAEFNGEKHQLIQRNVIKLSDYLFSFSRLGLGLKIEKDKITNEQDVFRGIGLGYYIWMRNDISD